MTKRGSGGMSGGQVGAERRVNGDNGEDPCAAIPIGSRPRALLRCSERTIERKVRMPQAIMDPGEVRRFAEELKRFNIETQNRMSLLQARFSALGDTWQDQEHAKFSEEFRDTMKVLKRFIESSNQHTPFLLRKAQRIEEYLDQH